MNSAKSSSVKISDSSWSKVLRQQLLIPYVAGISLILFVLLMFSQDGGLSEFETATGAIKATFLTVALVGGVLFAYLYFLLGKLGEKITFGENAIHQIDSTDSVTGVYNHRAFFSHLERELNRRNRYDQPLSILVLDIDQLTELNRTYGLEVGNVVLNDLAGLLKEEGRNVDFVCRYRGEKFAMILPQTPAEGAMIIAERLRKMIEAKGMAPSNSELISITVSVGIATSPEHGATVFDLISAADSALLSAKEAGRNKVCSYKASQDNIKNEVVLD